MVLNCSQFEIVTLLTLGFLCLIGFVGIALSILFKSRVYYFYCGYILSILIFIIGVCCKATDYFPRHTFATSILQLVIDATQMIANFMFTAFIYFNMIQEDSKFKKLRIAFQLYVGYMIVYLAIMLLFPHFVQYNISYFIISRVVVVLFSVFFYVAIIKELKNTYFRFFFLAISFLFLSGFMALWDSVTNYNSILNLGFQYLCVGYVLENICFVCAFIYKYFSTDQLKKEAEIQHELELSEVQLEMKQQTMQHIGREIHDNVGQKMTLASLYMQQLAYENKSPSIQNTIESINAIINQSLNDLRHLSKSLICNVIESNSLQELLVTECKRFNELKKCKLSFVANSEIPDLTYQTKSILLRISQEFIQNSIKHSQANNVNIRLHYTNYYLHIFFQDDGKGFDLDKNNTTGIGLINIKKRANLIGATYIMNSAINEGTKLTLELRL